MCGRFTETATEDLLEQRYDARADFPITPHYNISPTALVVTILDEEPSVFQTLQWGFKPKWLASKSKALINAQAETLMEKVTFKKSFDSKRCLVPATGFYEWKREGDKKQPYYFKLKEEPIFSFAGLWSEDKDDEGNPFRTFTIITTEANELMSDVHNRMPVILHPTDESEWLNMDSPGISVAHLLKPYESSLMSKHQVSVKVNNPRNNNQELINSL